MVTLLLVTVALSATEAGVIAYHAPAAIAPAAAIVPAATLYAAPAPLVRTPSLDSAVVHSERVGGNFAYSTVEGHAYTALSPIVHHAPVPAAVAVTYRASPIVHAPVVYAAANPAKAVFYTR